nr:N-acetylmuramoyl-L-alanine amidase [Methylomarinum sp. Ch1-1]MDP4520025.1 N-acetylmuramoyl-L-alanine amidase [Methylomarinum sp. Ch1-1]
MSVAWGAEQIKVDSLRLWTAPDHTRLVFDVSQAPMHTIFPLHNPSRLVIDISNAKLNQPLQQPPHDHPLFTKVRAGVRNKTDLRVVLDLNGDVTTKSFALKPSHKYGNRLVIDLFPKGNQAVVANGGQRNAAIKTVKNKARDIIVAVDAGHGGEDPGAHGPRGTQEKKVVFSIAQKLAELIDRQPGMKAVMVRKGDYYIKLRKRMEIARQARADLFVSIHADAFKSSRVKGASVFTLSRRGASSEAARWLAYHENSADLELAGGVSLDDKDEMLASVLLDLSQTATKEASRKVGANVLNNFKRIGHLHKNTVQKAGFMVLKSPDIPSILVETAFISNPTEERKLRSRTHQQKMAQAIFNGILSYFKDYAPADTLMASVSAGRQAKHVITRGETLSGIAQRYGVSMRSLKAANALGNNVIRIGQVLKIPADS